MKNDARVGRQKWKKKYGGEKQKKGFKILEVGACGELGAALSSLEDGKNQDKNGSE